MALVFSELRSKTRCGVKCSEAITITEGQPERLHHEEVESKDPVDIET